MKSDDKEGFFFTCLDLMKINKITRYNRKAKGGYWKISGKPRIIRTKGTIIGIKKTVLFYTSLHKKTNWVYHEYSAKGENFPPNKVYGFFFYFGVEMKKCKLLVVFIG
jgi:hypothetical protein